MKRRTTEDFKNEVEEIVGEEYSVLGEYEKSTSKIKMCHNVCGTIFEPTPARFLSGTRCPKCRSSHIPKSEETFKSEMPSGYILLSSYINAKTKVFVKHVNCGYEWWTNPSTLRKGHGCPKCANNLKKTTNEFQLEVKDYEILGEYEGNKEKIRVKHRLCGYEWETRPNDLLSGYGCPRCAHINSRAEKEIVEYIKSIYSGIVIENDRSVIGPLELDIYLPEIGVALEYDGLYWHSEGKKDKNYHLIKTQKCEEKGIILWHVFANEWKEQTGLIKERIKHLIAKEDNRISGRKCIVKEIGAREKNDFLAMNHIQGADKAKISLGLFYERTLVGVMTFSENTISRNTSLKDGQIELSRYATLLGNNVIGGFGKLLKYFWEHYKYNEILTYADRRYTNRKKNIYLNNGFTEVAASTPNYWIVGPGEKLYHRYNFTKQKIKEKYGLDGNVSEDELLSLLNLHKIYDCGTLRYSLKRA